MRYMHIIYIYIILLLMYIIYFIYKIFFLSEINSISHILRVVVYRCSMICCIFFNYKYLHTHTHTHTLFGKFIRSYLHMFIVRTYILLQFITTVISLHIFHTTSIRIWHMFFICSFKTMSCTHSS